MGYMGIEQRIQTEFRSVGEIFDPRNILDEILKKKGPRLALEITPAKKHEPCQDLFRVYTFKLLKELSKKFEIVVIYRDLQANINLSIEESRDLIERNISLMRSSNIPFTVYYESEILRNYMIHMPEKFFGHLYKHILNKRNNNFYKPLRFSSTSLSIIIPLLEILKVDVLLCMEEEKENIKILESIFRDAEYFPVVFYRSLRDMANKKHNPSDNVRAFPMIHSTAERLYDLLKRYKTGLETLQEWYEKLNLSKERVFEFNKEKFSFDDLLYMIRQKKISRKNLFVLISRHLTEFLAQEGKFLEIASRELKININDEKTSNLFASLNAPSRIKIINSLNKGDFSAYQIAREIKVSLPTTLFHLRKLQETGIIERKNKMYSLKINRFILYL